VQRNVRIACWDRSHTRKVISIVFDDVLRYPNREWHGVCVARPRIERCPEGIPIEGALRSARPIPTRMMMAE
jgi:hypothetical protein